MTEEQKYRFIVAAKQALSRGSNLEEVLHLTRENYYADLGIEYESD